MTRHEALRTYLAADAALAALVGARIYHLRAPVPAGSLPYLIYSQQESEHVRHFVAGSGLVKVSWEFQAFAESAEGAFAVIEAVREALDNYKGPLAGGLSGEFYLMGQSEAPVTRFEHTQLPVYAYVSLFDGWHAESVTGI